VNYLETDDLHARLRALGFSRIEDLGPAQIAARYLPGRTGALPDQGEHILHATTVCASATLVELPLGVTS
jgi:hypothetical protein